VTQAAESRHVADRGRTEISAYAPVKQRSEGVGGFPRLGDRKEQRARRYHHMPVAVFARHFDRAGNPCDVFQPVTRHHAGVEAGAAGNDVDMAYLLQQLVRVDAEDIG